LLSQKDAPLLPAAEMSVRKSVVRKYILLLVAVAILGLLGLYSVGNILTGSELHSVGSPPSDLNVDEVSIVVPDRQNISGWFVTGNPDMGGILLLHSVRSDRREMVGRARFLNKAGYSVLLIDMQGHGESSGKNITFGFRESFGVRSSLAYLQKQVGKHKVGVLGVSLGGAASLLGESPVEANAVIFEAVYSSIEKAVINRISIRLGSLGQYLAPLLTWQIEPRLGISLKELSPVESVHKLTSPVLFIAGTLDRHTLRDESMMLYEQANEPKKLWFIDGASHENFHIFAKKDYEMRVLEFFEMYLRGVNS